jgi:Lanthionine synthetase C-like protein
VLYDPGAFEPLTDEVWDEARVRDAVAAIVSDADDAFDEDGLWPENEWDAWEAKTPLKDLYVGAGGVVWALDALRRRGHAETRLDLAVAARRALERWRAEPDLIGGGIELPQPPESSLLCGETGLLLVAWRLAPSAELADTLLERVRANENNEADELMWGSPGTLLAAQAMHEWTGEERWAEAWDESAEALLARRDDDGLWTQRLYGQTARYLGPVHGLVGNVHALLQRSRERNTALQQATAALLVDEAVIEDGLATWPALAGGELVPRDGQIRLQWCHGAPGMVATAAPYLDEELLLAGAELTWQAGAHGAEKGSGLCHGTVGNGYALLKAFARTGHERWLQRARRFAVHALREVERSRAENGRGRYSLFTGDVGAALFAAACLDADPRFPILDGWH